MDAPAGRSAEKRGAERVLTPALVAACFGYFMVILDTTIVNVALPPIRDDLGTDLAGLQWVVDSYLVVLAAGILTGGALCDRYTARTVFRVGIALFTLASLACGLAPTTGTLIGARALQGAASALCVPSSLALVRAGYTDPALRRRAIGLWALISAFGAAAGPVVGGLGVEAWSWRLVFLVNVPIGLVVLALTTRHVPRGEGIPRALDLTGQVLAVVTLGALAVALIEGAHAGLEPVVVGAAVLCVLTGLAFVAVELRVREPMLPLGLFRDATVAGGAVIGLLINFGFYGPLFVLNLYFQNERGLSPLEAGFALLPQLAGIIPGSAISARWSSRAGGPTGTACLGMFITGTGMAGLLLAGSGVPYAVLVLPLTLTGLGMGLTMPAVTAALTDAVPPHHAGLASGVINASRQTGSVIGIALLGGLVGVGDDFVVQLRYALDVAALAFFVAVILAATCLGRTDRRSGRMEPWPAAPLPPPVASAPTSPLLSTTATSRTTSTAAPTNTATSG